jgi:hypothetical protein
MKEIIPNLFIGTISDYELEKSNDDFYTVIAAKEPYHRIAVGYSGRSCGKEHPEYLFAERDRCLICNLVDVPNPEWISPVIISRAFECIDNALVDNKQVLICCNQGQSRSATIGLMYMKKLGYFERMKFEEAEQAYLRIYPDYSPADGMRGFAQLNWGALGAN